MVEPILENLRYIVFLIDSEYKNHDGKVFVSLNEAREFCKDVIAEKYADKIIIGMFEINGSRNMHISMIETFGFKGDSKNENQLTLFTKFS